MRPCLRGMARREILSVGGPPIFDLGVDVPKGVGMSNTVVQPRVYDASRLRQLVGDDPKAISQILKIACEMLPRVAHRLGERDLTALEARHIAHQLKGASLSAGADEVADLATALEAELASDWTGRARALALAMPAAARRFIAASAAAIRAGIPAK